MFGGARVIWIDAQGRTLPALEPLFARPPSDCAIVVKAGQLKKGTGLRAAFETSPIRASIECYSDDPDALESLVNAEARAAGLSVAPDARASLIALIGADRQTTRREIAKLMLYARDDPPSRLRMSKRSFRMPRRPTSTRSPIKPCSATCRRSRHR